MQLTAAVLLQTVKTFLWALGCVLACIHAALDTIIGVALPCFDGGLGTEDHVLSSATEAQWAAQNLIVDTYAYRIGACKAHDESQFEEGRMLARAQAAKEYRGARRGCVRLGP